jgi:hypothetical protein
MRTNGSESRGCDLTVLVRYAAVDEAVVGRTVSASSDDSSRIRYVGNGSIKHSGEAGKEMYSSLGYCQSVVSFEYVI